MLRGKDPTIDNHTVTTDAYIAEGLTINRAGLWTFIYSTKLDLVIQYDEGKYKTETANTSANNNRPVLQMRRGNG